MPLLDTADVHHDVPQPGVEALHVLQIASPSKSVSEGLLHCIARTFDIAEHPEREGQKAPVTVSVSMLDSCDEVRVRGAHNLY
jgi:hypothetical protein